MIRPANETTIGDYGDEPQACKAFDIAMAGAPFRVYPEVTGEYIQPRIGSPDKGARIDRLLIPTNAAVSLGWRQGIIGVEIKKSGHKLGRAVSQCLDYTRVSWCLPPAGWKVLCDWVCIWPADKPGGAMASVMANNRIGVVRPAYGGGIEFVMDGRVAISLKDGAMQTSSPLSGCKSGSR